MTVLINPFLPGGPSLLSAITAAGLTANLKLCLDAGDSASYPGSGSTWADMSGNGNNFTKGVPPSFHGGAGGLSSNDYWMFTGSNASAFALASGSNPAWLETFHQDNATLTWLAAFWPSASVEAACGDRNGTGVELGHDSSGKVRIVVNNGASTVLSHSSTASLSNGAWNIAGQSINEAGGATGGIDFINGSAATFNPTYSSPSAGSAGGTLAVCQRFAGTAAGEWQAASRFVWIALWDIALSSANFSAIFAQTRGRFSI